MLNDFERYERLVRLNRAKTLVANTAADAMQGSMIYTFFSGVVTYAGFYKYVRTVHAEGCDVTATITLAELIYLTWLNTKLSHWQWTTLFKPLVYNGIVLTPVERAMFLSIQKLNSFR